MYRMRGLRCRLSDQRTFLGSRFRGFPATGSCVRQVRRVRKMRPRMSCHFHSARKFSCCLFCRSLAGSGFSRTVFFRRRFSLIGETSARSRRFGLRRHDAVSVLFRPACPDRRLWADRPASRLKIRSRRRIRLFSGDSRRSFCRQMRFVFWASLPSGGASVLPRERS